MSDIEWKVLKSNDDAERAQLNKILADIRQQLYSSMGFSSGMTGANQTVTASINDQLNAMAEAWRNTTARINVMGDEVQVIGEDVLYLNSAVFDPETGLEATASALEVVRTEVDTLNDTVLAMYSLELDANGYIVGWKFTNDGSTGIADFRADRFRITAPGSMNSFEVRDGLIDSSSSTHSLYQGVNFGVNSDLIMWYGPTPSAQEEGASKSNGLFYIGNNGLPHFGGTLDNDRVEELPVVEDIKDQISDIIDQLDDFEGIPDWDINRTYSKGSLVKYQNGLYLALQNVPIGTAITNSLYWDRVGNYSTLGEAVAYALETSSSNTTELAAQASTLNTISTRMPSGTGALATAASVTSEATARANADSALSQRTQAMESRMPAGTGGLATAQSVTQVTNRVSTVEGTVQAHTQQISDNTAAIADKANSSTVTALSNTVTQQGNTLTAHGTQLSGLSATVGGNSASINELWEVSAQAASGNAVLNAGFEETAHWQFDGAVEPAYQTTGQAYSGSRVLRFDPGAGNAINLFRQRVHGGQVVRMGGMVRPYSSLPNSGARLRLIARRYDLAGGYLGWSTVAYFNPPTSFNWQPFSARYSVPADTFYVAYQLTTDAHTSGQIIVDNVYLEPESNTLADVLARYTLAVQAGGDVAGIQLLAGGGISAIRFLANSFQIVDPGGAARTEYSAGTWTVHDSANRLRMKWGVW